MTTPDATAAKMEAFHREAKCHAVARFICSEALRIIEGLSEAEWARVAELSGKNRPSEQSIERIVEILRGKLNG